MKIILSIFSLFCCFSFAQAQNTNITLNSDLNLNCKFEKVILTLGQLIILFPILIFINKYIPILNGKNKKI